MLTSQNLAGISILTPEIVPENFRLYLKDWLLYRKICEIPWKAGLQNAEWSIKCEIGHMTSSLSDLQNWNRYFIRARAESRFRVIFWKSGLRCINFWLILNVMKHLLLQVKVHRLNSIVIKKSKAYAKTGSLKNFKNGQNRKFESRFLAK